MKWRSATWNTARGSRARRVSAWHLKNLRRRDVFRGSSPPCYRDINRIESDEEDRRETSSYISAEETKSAREVYIRVAVIDSVIRAGITNIYIDGRHKDLVLSAAHSRRERTISRIADMQIMSTSFMMSCKERNYSSGSNIRTPTIYYGCEQGGTTLKRTGYTCHCSEPSPCGKEEPDNALTNR